MLTIIALLVTLLMLPRWYVDLLRLESLNLGPLIAYMMARLPFVVLTLINDHLRELLPILPL